MQKKSYSTVLHALVNTDWEDLNAKAKTLPLNFFTCYNKLIAEVIQHNPSIVDIQDEFGNTPLQIYIQDLKIQETMISPVRNVVAKLRSDKNINKTNLDGKTVLHYLTEAFPMFTTNITQAGLDTFLCMVKEITSHDNTNIPESSGKTALHVLPEKYSNDVTKYCNLNLCKEIFADLVKSLGNFDNINIGNEAGDTILHIFANKCAKASDSDAKTLLQLMINLVERCKTLAQDGKGRTMLHIMMGNYHAKYDHSLIGNLVKMFVKKDATIVNIQDDQEYTALHILAGKFPNEVSTHNSESYLEMIEDLASDINRDIKESKGYTALQVVANNCRKDMTEGCEKLFPKLVMILKSPININFQDENGSTVLHTISKRVFFDPSLGNHILPILPDITSINVNTVDTSSFTPYSWILKGKDAYMNNRDVQSMFIKIEQFFMMKGADSDVSKWELPELRDTAEDPSSPQKPLGNKIHEAAVDELTNLLESL